MDSGQPRLHFQILIIQSDIEPHQQIKWAGNGDGSNVRLGVRWTRDSLENAHAGGAFKSIIQSDMEPHQQMKWAGNGDGSNVRLGVRWTPDSLENAQGVLSNLNYTIQYGASSTNQMGWEWVRK